MRSSGPWAVLLLLATFVAGCSGGGKSGTQEALDFGDLEATQTTGIIRGLVVDEAIVPVQGVNITVLLGDVNRTTQSSEDGLFGMDDLLPGTYLILASKFGYTPVQSSATVTAGDDEPETVKIMLVADPALVPYHDSLEYSGFIGCSFTTPSVSFAACGLPGLEDATNNRFLVNYQAASPPAWIQVEAVWSSTQPLGGELSLSITALGPPQVGVNDTAGKSPMFITVNETEAARFDFGVNETDISIRLFSSELTGTDVVPEEMAWGPYASNYQTFNSTGVPAAYGTVVDSDPCLVGCLLVNPFGNPACVQYPVLFDDCYRFGGAGFAVNQKVTVYTHIFYGYTPPPGWRFSEASDVPDPPT